MIVELWKTRFLLCIIYMALNLFTSLKFPYFDKLVFLVKDGVIFPLIASIYLFDRITLNVVATCFPVITIIFNIGLLREIHQKTVQSGKTARHDFTSPYLRDMEHKEAKRLSEPRE